MSHIKKFTDFFAGFGAFCAAIYLIMQFMPFEPLETDPPTGKLTAFLQSSEKVDHMAYLILIGLFILSLLVSRIGKKYPLPVFGVSLLPLIWSFYMFDADLLKERPMVFLIAALLNTSGAFADTLLADKKDGRDGRKRAHCAAALCSAVIAVLSLLLYLQARSTAGIPAEEWNVLNRAIGQALEKDLSFSPYLRIALMFALITVISLLLQGLYFLDTLISLIPGIFVLSYWSSEALPAYGASVAVLTAICFFSRLILTFSPPTKEVPANPPAKQGFWANLGKKLTFKK